MLVGLCRFCFCFFWGSAVPATSNPTTTTTTTTICLLELVAAPCQWALAPSESRLPDMYVCVLVQRGTAAKKTNNKNNSSKTETGEIEQGAINGSDRLEEEGERRRKKNRKIRKRSQQEKLGRRFSANSSAEPIPV